MAILAARTGAHDLVRQSIPHLRWARGEEAERRGPPPAEPLFALGSGHGRPCVVGNGAEKALQAADLVVLAAARLLLDPDFFAVLEPGVGEDRLPSLVLRILERRVCSWDLEPDLLRDLRLKLTRASQSETCWLTCCQANSVCTDLLAALRQDLRAFLFFLFPSAAELSEMASGRMSLLIVLQPQGA